MSIVDLSWSSPACAQHHPVINMPSFVATTCSMLGAGLMCLIGSAAVAEIAFRTLEPLRKSLGWAVDELPQVRLNMYGQPDLRKYESAALFLYNASIEGHHHFLHDVKAANTGHKVPAFELECSEGEAQKTLCAQYGHGGMEYEEPPMMFFRYGQWSESYHDDVQTGKVPKPTGRKERVRALVKWLDTAASRAEDTIMKRESRLAEMRAMGSPSQQMRKQMDKRMAEEEKQKQRKAGQKKAEL